MAIDFGGALIGDNYSTGVLAKLNATDIANAVWLDSAYTSYTGTITTGAKRITTGGVIEQYNGSAWVALSVGYVLKAGDTMSGTLNTTRVTFSGAAAGAQGTVATDSSFGSILSASVAYGISTNSAGGLDIMANQAGQLIRFYAGTANNASPSMIACVSQTGLSVTGTIGASETITSTASGAILQRTGASTAAQIIRLANTTGDFYFGIESSVAGSFFPTSSAYASVLYSTQPVQTIVNGVKITDTNAAGLAVTGTLSSTGDYKIAGTGIYNAIATNTSLGLFADTNAYAGIKAYGSSHATKANVTELLAGAGVVVGTVSSTGLAVTGTLNTATTTALSWGGDTTAGHTLGTRGTGSSLFINTGGLNTSYASGLAVDGSYSSLVSTVNIRALGTYSGGGYEAKLAFFTSSDTTQGQRMLLSSTGLAVTGTLSATGDISASSVSLPDGNVVTWGAGTATYIQGNQASAYMNFIINSVNRMALTSAGLAVTGTLSATKRAYTSATAVSFSATPTFDASTTNIIVFGNLTANVTSMTMTNAQEGHFISIRFRQDATGGRTVALPSGAKVSGSIATTANLTSYLNITYNATDSRWEGNWSNIPA